MSEWREPAGLGACPACGEPLTADDVYCEACGAAVGGASLGSAPAGAGSLGLAPGAGAAPAPAAAPPPPTWAPPPAARRGRHEIVDGPVAAVSDRGTTHWRNEDAVGLRWVGGDPGGFVLVVCDGVSVSQDPHLVSQAAVDTALLVLSGAVSAGGDLDAAMVEATAAAQRAAASVPYDPALDVGPGACTFVAAAVRGNRATFGSVGDSRAYWVDDAGAVQIGRDDSLAAELVASGHLTHQQAMARAGAHALTKWLGVDSTDAAPTLTSVELPGPGLVVLASDGLWNYAPAPADLAGLIGPVGAETSLDLVRRLAAFAEDAGGADNITVAVGPYGLQGQEAR